MEGALSAYEMIKRVAACAIRNQKRNPWDYVGSDGLLVCGKCGEPRQTVMNFSTPTREDPNHTSGVIITKMCRCETEDEDRRKREEQAEKDMKNIQKLRKISLMDEKFFDATFDALEVTKYNERNLKLCRRYADKFDSMIEKNQGLILWGNTGTGKSFAAACIANHLLIRRVPVIMTSLVEILKAIQAGRENETEILARFNYAKLVIFDDLGAERGTDYALEKIYNIIDSRYRKKLPMILTTNLTLDEMKGELDIRYRRIYDRIFEVCYPMQFTGPSWRKREASRRFEEMQKLLEEED